MIFFSFSFFFFFFWGGTACQTPPPSPPSPILPLSQRRSIPNLLLFMVQRQRYLHKICTKNVLVRVLTVVFKLWVTRETVSTVLCRHGLRDQ